MTPGLSDESLEDRVLEAIPEVASSCEKPGADVDDVTQAVIEETGHSRADVHDALSRLTRSGRVYQPESWRIRVTP